MRNNTPRNHCLVISYGPVPTPQYQKIEGGGMRAWGLAQGLKANGLNVTVGVNAAFPQNVDEHEGIKITNWSPDDQFAAALNSYDVVVVSYCMGNDSVFIADNIKDDVLLVLDAYVPIYVEVSARESEDITTELKNYLADIQRFNHVLKRGDYFLCANEVQKIFYTGVLGSLGIINPRSYRQARLLVVPFGIHDAPLKPSSNPYRSLGIKETDKVILWFGGLYPWFRIQEYLDAVSSLSKKHQDMKFVIVGGKNPFNPNPDFFKQYEKAVAFAETNNLINKNMFFVDWVDYDDRSNWYAYADFVISINQPGEENRFSWRTRVMDYVWGEVVTLTNGGDPLSEDLLQNEAAVRLKNLSSSEISSAIESIYAQPKTLQDVKENLRKLKPNFYWHNVTKPLTQAIQDSLLPYSDEKSFKNQQGVLDVEQFLVQPSGKSAKVKKLIRVVPRTISYAKRKGLKRTANLAAGIVRSQAKKRLSTRAKQFVFITHPLDNTGAPLVMLQIIDEVRQKYGSRAIRVFASYSSTNNVKTLTEKKVKLYKCAVMGLRLTGMQLGLKKDDFVMLNTVAVYPNYRDYIFNLLSANRLKHAYWFIHEDTAQLKVVAPELQAKEYVKKVQKLVKAGKLTILVPSQRVKQAYDDLFGINSVVTVPLHVSVADKFQVKRPAVDYAKIGFLLSGTPSDGRKGQLIALSAFQKFLDIYHAKDPKQYRDFSVHFVSIAQDYVSEQIKSIGHTVLGKRLHVYPALPREEALEITSRCNAVICCSLNETFALYVAEGMAMGHVVLRNNSAGMEEQLQEGENGFYINSDDIEQFAKVIEKILNKSTKNESLQKMGKQSQLMVADWANNSYLDILGL